MPDSPFIIDVTRENIQQVIQACCTDMRLTIAVLMLAGASVAADSEIHRCLLEDGTTAFQETPCPEPAVNADDGTEAGVGTCQRRR